MESLLRKINLASWILAATAAALGIGWFVGWGKNIPTQIPLFYSKPWGDEQLAAPLWIWVPIGMAAGAGAINGILNRRLAKYPVLQTTTAAVGLISQIILVTAVIRIIILVM